MSLPEASFEGFFVGFDVDQGTCTQERSQRCIHFWALDTSLLKDLAVFLVILTIVAPTPRLGVRSGQSCDVVQLGRGFLAKIPFEFRINPNLVGI